MNMKEPLILSNARLVLADEIVERGWIIAENGAISAFGSRLSALAAAASTSSPQLRSLVRR